MKMKGMRINRQQSAEAYHQKNRKIQRKPSDKSIKASKQTSINCNVLDQNSILKFEDYHSERSPYSHSVFTASMCYISPRCKELFPSASTSAINKNQSAFFRDSKNSRQLSDKFVRHSRKPLANLQEETESEYLRLELDGSKKENQSLKTELQRLKSEIKRVQEQKSFFDNQYQNFKTQLEELNQVVAKLKQQNQTLNSQFKGTEAHLQQIDQHHQCKASNEKHFQIINYLNKKMRYDLDDQRNKIEKLKQINLKYMGQIEYWKWLAEVNSRFKVKSRSERKQVNKENEYESLTPIKKQKRVLTESIFQLSPD